MKLGQATLHHAVTTLAIIVMLLMLLSIGRNLFHALSIRSEISQMEDKATSYREQIVRDSTLLEELKYNDQLEKYARENYRMQRRGERVYIVE